MLDFRNAMFMNLFQVETIIKTSEKTMKSKILSAESFEKLQPLKNFSNVRQVRKKKDFVNADIKLF